jgi:hypothetical protein
MNYNNHLTKLKMKKIFTLIVILSLSTVSFGQTLSEKEIVGKWEVEKIIKKPSNPQFSPLLEGFENSTFSFNQNGGFVLNTTSNTKLFEAVIEMTNGTQWKLGQNNTVNIGSEADGYTIMEIVIREFNDKTLFHLSESGITLLMIPIGK